MKVFKFFFPKCTKWIVLECYNQNGKDFVCLVKKNLDTGMLYFKVKRITPDFNLSYMFNHLTINIQKQFQTILDMEK